MPDDNRRTSLHKQNSSENVEEVPQLKLSTDNQIVMGKAQNKEKREKKNFFSFLKQNTVSEGDKSNTGRKAKTYARTEGVLA